MPTRRRAVLITLLCIATMAVDQNNPFIYFRF